MLKFQQYVLPLPLNEVGAVTDIMQYNFVYFVFHFFWKPEKFY